MPPVRPHGGGEAGAGGRVDVGFRHHVWLKKYMSTHGVFTLLSHMDPMHRRSSQTPSCVAPALAHTITSYPFPLSAGAARPRRWPGSSTTCGTATCSPPTSTRATACWAETTPPSSRHGWHRDASARARSSVSVARVRMAGVGRCGRRWAGTGCKGQRGREQRSAGRRVVGYLGTVWLEVEGAI